MSPGRCYIGTTLALARAVAILLQMMMFSTALTIGSLYNGNFMRAGVQLKSDDIFICYEF